MNKILLFLGILLLATSCASKRYTKKASKFEEAGLYEDAAEYYYEAIKRKDSNVDAKLGLRKNGQLVLEEKLADFNNAYKQGNNKEAVYSYLDAENYFNKVKAIGVNLDFSEINKAYYSEAKEEYLDIRYAEAIENLNREDFNAARIILEEIINIDNNYKDTNEKYIIAKYEPMYREGLHLLDIELYRKAYYTFDEILSGAGQYKQVLSLKEEAHEKGTITILVDEFTYTKSNQRVVSTAINTAAKGSLSALENPFIKIVEPASFNAGIYENEEINMEAASLAGIKAVLACHIIGVASIPGKLVKTTQKAYIKEITKKRNEAGEEYEKVDYYKTEYKEYEIRNRSQLDLSFKLVSTENGEIMRRVLVTPTISSVGNFTCPLVEVEMEVGQTTDPTANPVMIVEYTKDGGTTYHNHRPIPLGKFGDARKRVPMRLFGRIVRHQDFNLRFTITDNVRVQFYSLWADLEIEV